MSAIEHFTDSIYGWFFGTLDSCKDSNSKWMKFISLVLRMFVIALGIFGSYVVSVLTYEVISRIIVPVIFFLISMALSRAGILFDLAVEYTGADAFVALGVSITVFLFLSYHVVIRTGWVNKIVYHYGGKPLRLLLYALLILYAYVLLFGEVEYTEDTLWAMAVLAMVIAVITLLTRYWRIPIFFLTVFVITPFIIIPVLQGGQIISKADIVEEVKWFNDDIRVVNERRVISVSQDFFSSSRNASLLGLDLSPQTRFGFRGFKGFKGFKGKSKAKSIKSKPVSKAAKFFSAASLTKALNYVKLKVPKFISKTTKPVAKTNLNATKPIRQFNKSLMQKGKALAQKIFGKGKANQQVAKVENKQLNQSAKPKKTDGDQINAKSNAQHKAQGNARVKQQMAKRRAEAEAKMAQRQKNLDARDLKASELTKSINRPNVNGFATPKLLRQHWRKHKDEYPNLKSKEDYSAKAISFFKNPPEGTLTGIRGNGWSSANKGDIVQYNPATNNFAIISKDGNIRTMFKPNKGTKEYFYESLKAK